MIGKHGCMLSCVHISNFTKRRVRGKWCYLWIIPIADCQPTSFFITGFFTRYYSSNTVVHYVSTTIGHYQAPSQDGISSYGNRMQPRAVASHLLHGAAATLRPLFTLCYLRVDNAGWEPHQVPRHWARHNCWLNKHELLLFLPWLHCQLEIQREKRRESSDKRNTSSMSYSYFPSSLVLLSINCQNRRMLNQYQQTPTFTSIYKFDSIVLSRLCLCFDLLSPMCETSNHLFSKTTIRIRRWVNEPFHTYSSLLVVSPCGLYQNQSPWCE